MILVHTLVKPIIRPAAAAVATVVLSPLSAAPAVGDAVTFGARCLDASGAVVPGAVVAWTSGNPSVFGQLAVSGNTVTGRALAAGQAVLVATYHPATGADVTATAQVGVGAGAVTPPTVTPPGGATGGSTAPVPVTRALVSPGYTDQILWGSPSS